MLELLVLESRKEELFKATNTEGFQTDVSKALILVNNMAADAQKPLLTLAPRLDEFSSWQFWRKRHRQKLLVMYSETERESQPVERILEVIKCLGYSMVSMYCEVNQDENLQKKLRLDGLSAITVKRS
ncbi:hypothetical protein CHISP_3289 [Chitinispirillum alkaliphilum]|nr:hypothetical protein CHISP_3289 [Chitinispirillum alkaliphilum]